MRSLQIALSTWGTLLLLTAATGARSQDAGREDSTPCTASPHPAPAQSGVWEVAFCNRTAHDIVVQFHDNDCPTGNWSRRGDVYEKRIRRGESAPIFLCYANEPRQAASLAPGVPMMRIPGGKGVVTTWNVVGDCGDRSDRSHLDARTFYDRGDYETGIVLLQYPAGTSHCYGESPASAQPPVAAATPETRGPRSTAIAPAPTVAATPAPASAPSTTLGAAPASAPAPAVSGAPGALPSLSAMIDAQDRFTRTVRVFATNAQNTSDFRCRFKLALDFSDGSSWNDSVKVDIRNAVGNVPVVTRKYGKSVTKVVLSATECAPL